MINFSSFCFCCSITVFSSDTLACNISHYEAHSAFFVYESNK
jgi:hypothetical protein